MTPHDEHELAREIGRALEALPTPRAPRTLLPRLLASVDAAHDPTRATAGRRPWFAWPPLAQAALIIVVLAGVSAAYWLWPVIETLTAAWLPEPVHEAGRRADAAASVAGDLLRVGTLVWEAVVAPIAKTLLTVTLALSAACALLAAALGRLALGGAPQS